MTNYLGDTENIKGDITEITEIADAMNVDPDALEDNENLSRFQEIIEFFSGKEDKRFFINGLIRKMDGKGDKIGHIWNYVQLRKEHSATKERLNKIKEEINYYE